MKRNLLIFCAIINLACYSTKTFCQTFAWAKTGPVSTSSTMVRSATGDLYISMGAYILKFDSTGNFQWQQTLSGFFITGIVTDSIGNLFVGGGFNGSKSIGPYTVTANTSYFCIFVAKFDPAGVVQWLEQSYDNASTVMDDIAIDNYGNPLVLGRFQDSLKLGSYVFDAPATNQVFLAKYSNSGGCMWAKHLVAGSFGGGLPGPKLKTDAFGNEYVAGQFLSWAQFDSIYVTASDGLDDSFILKLDPSGNCIWLKAFGGDSDEYVYSFSVDRQGNSYVSGYYGWPNCYFDSYTLTGTPTDNNYTAKYDSNGNFKWANLQASSLITAFDQGFYTSNSYLSKYDTSGTLIWNKFVTGAAMKAIVAVGNDDIYVSGSFNGTVAFDTITLSVSSTTLYLGKIGAPGITTEVADKEESLSLSVYPNPTRDIIHFLVNSEETDLRIQVRNVLGQLQFEKTYNNISEGIEGDIDLGKYSKGLYYVQLSADQYTITKTVILN